ncbi:MAG TPA: chloride channel protein [Acidimicrobiia bacterium]|nr:chloride channel protein [Acidimicrobiia bacterium]
MTAISRAWRRIPSAVIMADRAGGRFFLLSALTGVVVGVGAWALIESLHFVETAVSALTEMTYWWVFVTVPLGLMASWAIARFLAPEVEGDGVPEAATALIVRGGHIRGRVAPLKIVATGLALGAGGSGGREGPIVLIGASIGSKIARSFNLGEDQIRSLVAAGAGAGIGAAFNAPIAGMLFALEVILSSFAVRHMSSIVVASVAAAITSRSLVQEDLTLAAQGYTLESPWELVLYVALALVVVVAAWLFLRLLDRIETSVHRRGRTRSWTRPLTFGLVTAAVIAAEPVLLGGDSLRLFGTGQAVTNQLLESATGVLATPDTLADVWWVLGLVAVGKILATSLTLGSGASAGAFMPTLFIGAMIGTAFARSIGPVWGVSAISTGSFAVVGMAAMFAAMGRAPLTAILLVFEVTGTREYGLILPLMLTAILATFLAELIHPESVYTMPLRRRGIAPLHQGEVDLLDTVTVGDVMSEARVVAGPDSVIGELRRELDRQRSHGAPVVAADGELVGIVTSTDMGTAANGDLTRVAAVMTRRPVTVTPDTPVSRAMERMAALGVGRLPVVAAHEPDRLVGMFRREDAVRAYHEALGARTDQQLVRARLDQRTHPGAGYYDFRVPPGSVADGAAVMEVNWPEGSTLVSVRRGRQVIVPEGATRLHADDVVTAFGSEESRAIMIERMNAGADEPTAELPIVLDEGGPDEPSPTIESPNDPGDRS